MKRVIFLADSISNQTAGIHYFGLQLIRNIQKTFPHYEFHSISSSIIDIDNIQQHIIPVKTSIPQHLRIRQLTTIPRKVNTLNPDVVIELAHFGPFKLNPAIKKVTVIHDMTAITHPEFHSASSHHIQKLTLPRIVKNADLILTNSIFTKKEISRVTGIDYSAKIHVLYPTLKYLNRSQEDHPASTQKTSPYFLSVGTIEPRKNYVSVIKAFEQFHRNHSTYELIIAGRKGWKNKQIYQALDNSVAKASIQVKENVSEEYLQQLYKEASAFISASHIEGFGLPILEAASFGTPLIVAKNSAQQEIVKDYGLTFNSLEISELASCMTTLATDHSATTQLKLKSQALFEDITSIRKKQYASLKF